MKFIASKFELSKEASVHFREIADEISVIASRFGVSIVSYRDPALPHFSRLSEAKKRVVLTRLSHQRDFFLIAQEEGLHPNSPQLIWRTFARMGLTPQPDIFDKITEEDTVEVYHWDGTSSFKNLKFFEFISHTIEELFTLSWTEQWSVSMKQFLVFFEMNMKLRLAQYDATFAPQVSRYPLSEKLGERRRFDIHLKWVSPVLQNGQRKALLLVNRSAFAKD